MRIFARASSEGLYSGLAAEVVRRGGIEKCRPPRLCLDVLAQHLVSMATDGGYTLDEVMEILRRAYPFRDVTKEDVKDVLRMLAGDYEHDRDIPVRPRVLYDRVHERVEGDTYSRMLAVSAGGTIPDKGLYAVRTEDGVKRGSGRRVRLRGWATSSSWVPSPGRSPISGKTPWSLGNHPPPAPGRLFGKVRSGAEGLRPGSPTVRYSGT